MWQKTSHSIVSQIWVTEDIKPANIFYRNQRARTNNSPVSKTCVRRYDKNKRYKRKYIKESRPPDKFLANKILADNTQWATFHPHICTKALAWEIPTPGLAIHERFLYFYRRLNSNWNHVRVHISNVFQTQHNLSTVNELFVTRIIMFELNIAIRIKPILFFSISTRSWSCGVYEPK